MPVQPSAATRALHRDLIERHPADAVKLLERLTPAETAEILSLQPVETALPVWERMAPDLGAQVLEVLPAGAAAQVFERMDPSRAAALLSVMGREARDALLATLKPASAAELRLVLTHPEDSAGALMDPKVLLLRPETTVRQALSRIRGIRRRGVRVVFVVNEDNRLDGVVDIQDLATSRPTTRLEEIKRPVRAAVNALASREEVVETLDRFRLTDLPVVDVEGRLIGVVHYRNLMAVAEDEATVALQTMVGVSKEERALSRVGFAVRKRLPWLHINLATAFLAAAVVGLFESTIAQYTALAVLLPVVAGQSGNTGAQALAVTMRGLAVREIRPRHWPRVIFKEMAAGFLNGLAVALTTALGVWVWSASPGLALVIGTAMVLAMVIAGVSGAAIPILLEMGGHDPAQSSSIILTTVTDVVGFLSFLGIATLLTGLL
jgi:magnesium transporter